MNIDEQVKKVVSKVDEVLSGIDSSSGNDPGNKLVLEFEYNSLMDTFTPVVFQLLKQFILQITREEYSYSLPTNELVIHPRGKEILIKTLNSSNLKDLPYEISNMILLASQDLVGSFVERHLELSAGGK